MISADIIISVTEQVCEKLLLGLISLKEFKNNNSGDPVLSF